MVHENVYRVRIGCLGETSRDRPGMLAEYEAICMQELMEDFEMTDKMACKRARTCQLAQSLAQSKAAHAVKLLAFCSSPSLVKLTSFQA